jgi:hypothetical protein
MLNEEALQKLEFFKSLLYAAKSHGGPPLVGYYDIEWLVNTISWMNDRYVDHEDCCLSPCLNAYKIKDLQLELDQLKGNA